MYKDFNSIIQTACGIFSLCNFNFKMISSYVTSSDSSPIVRETGSNIKEQIPIIKCETQGKHTEDTSHREIRTCTHEEEDGKVELMFHCLSCATFSWLKNTKSSSINSYLSNLTWLYIRVYIINSLWHISFNSLKKHKPLFAFAYVMNPSALILSLLFPPSIKHSNTKSSIHINIYFTHLSTLISHSFWLYTYFSVIYLTTSTTPNSFICSY